MHPELINNFLFKIINKFEICFSIIINKCESDTDVVQTHVNNVTAKKIVKYLEMIFRWKIRAVHVIVLEMLELQR